MKLGSNHNFISTGFSAVLTLTIFIGLIGIGLFFYPAAADKDKLGVGAAISGQAGIGTAVNGTSASGNAAVSAQAGANVNSSSNSNSNPSSGTSSESSEYSQTTSANAESHGHFKSSYDKIYASSDDKFTIQTNKHLYKPGDEVDLDGTIWSGLTTTVGSINAVSINVIDNNGNVVYTGNNQVDSSGQYSATFQLPSDAKNGAYTVNVNANVSANVLGAVQSNTQASLSQETKFVVISPNAFDVKAEGQDFGVNIATNSSSVSNFNFDEQNKKISFTVQGQTGTKGVLDIDIPKPLLNGDLTVMMDGQAMAQSDIIETDAQDHTTLEINYHHSTHQIDIIGTNAVPEFPFSTIAMTMSILGSISVLAIFGNRLKI